MVPNCRRAAPIRPAGMKLQLVAGLEEWQQSEQPPWNDQDEQRISVRLLQFCVIARCDHLGDPALDENADVSHHVARRVDTS